LFPEAIVFDPEAAVIELRAELPPDPQADPVAVTTPETSSKQFVPVIAERVKALVAARVTSPEELPVKVWVA
jgi:hypothetical protein